MFQRLPHRVGRPLEPFRTFRRLFSRQYINKTTAEIAKLIGVFYMLIQRSRIILSKHVYPVDVGIDAIRYRNIYQTVFPCDGNGGLTSVLSKRKQPGTGSSAKYHCNY